MLLCDVGGWWCCKVWTPVSNKSAILHSLSYYYKVTPILFMHCGHALIVSSRVTVYLLSDYLTI